MINPFTTATPVGVTTRDITQIIGAVLAVLGALGLLDEEQRAVLTEQAPILFSALGTVIMVGVGIYRNRTKSSSDKAAEVGRQVDAKIPKADPVVIETQGSRPNIVVPGDK